MMSTCVLTLGFHTNHCLNTLHNANMKRSNRRRRMCWPRSDISHTPMVGQSREGVREPEQLPHGHLQVQKDGGTEREKQGG